jgi:hypothetical protein
LLPHGSEIPFTEAHQKKLDNRINGKKNKKPPNRVTAAGKFGFYSCLIWFSFFPQLRFDAALSERVRANRF